MRKIIHLLIIQLAFLVHFSAKAQINIGGKPYSFNKNVKLSKRKVPAVLMPEINLAELRAEDEEEELQGLPARFGYPIEVDLNLDNAGDWFTLPRGDRIWRLRVKSPGAKSINLLYNDFWLPKGALYYLYSYDRKHVIGGFTEQNNKGPRENRSKFNTGLVYSDDVILEYYEPKEVVNQGRISIVKVVHGYRFISIPGREKNFGNSDNCQININCSEGNNWQLEKTGVALILVNGFRICTGALLNTSNEDFVPYFLTADHCLGNLDAAAGNIDAAHWSFVWNYESPNCSSPSTEPQIFSTAGARLVANHANTDFALFRLTESPNQFGVTYLGWDAGSNKPSSGAGIHHPEGDIKKISVENNQIEPYNGQINWIGGGSTAPNTHWRTVFDKGGTEQGSSGSPLFDQNRRVVGQLHGGDGICPGDSDFDQFYGRFDLSFNGSNRNCRLSDWLYPPCSHDMDIKNDLSGEQPLFWAANNITANNKVYNGVFAMYRAGNSLDLKPGFEAFEGSEFIAKIGAACASPKNKSIAVDAYVPNELRKKKQNVQADIPSQKSVNPSFDQGLNIFPNPFKVETTLAFNLQKNLLVNVTIFNTLGKQVYKIQNRFPEGYNEWTFRNTQNLPPGVYLIRFQAGGVSETKQIMISR